MSNSSLKDSENNEVITTNDQPDKVKQKIIDLKANNGELSDKGSFSSEVSSQNGVKDTPFFSQGAFGTEMIKGQKNIELE